MDAFEAQACCQALSNGRRMALALALRSCEHGATPTLLAAACGIDQAQVSEQLGLLFDARLVTKARAGKAVIYYYNHHQFQELAKFIHPKE